MTRFQIDDMHCGHCVRSITEALNRADPAARLHFDLPARRLDIDAAQASPAALAAALQAAGYHPVALVEPAAPAADAGTAAAPARAGCCCR